MARLDMALRRSAARHAAPLVSVIIPTRNRAMYLPTALRSVFDQTFPNIEIVVVDDGSTDETAQILTEMNGRVRAIRLDGVGVSAARNRGIQEAQGDYIQFLDDDDTLDPQKIELQVRLLDRHTGVDVAYCGWTYVDEHGHPLHAIAAPESVETEDLVASNPFIVHALLIRRTCFDHVGDFDESLTAAEDWDMWVRIALAGHRFAGIPRPLCRYRMHGLNTLLVNAEAHDRDAARALDHLFNRPDLPEHYRARRADAELGIRAWVSWLYYAAGNWEAAQRTLKEAIDIQPGSSLKDPRWLENILWRSSYYPWIPDPLSYIDGVLSHLPDCANRVGVNRDEVLARVLIGVAAKHYATGHTVEGRACLCRAIALNTRVTTKPELFAEMLCFMADRLPQDSQRGWVRQILSDIPDDVVDSRRARGAALGVTHLVTAFQLYHAGHHSNALSGMMRAIRYRPRLLANRGVISVCLKSLAAPLRRMSGSMTPRGTGHS